MVKPAMQHMSTVQKKKTGCQLELTNTVCPKRAQILLIVTWR